MESPHPTRPTAPRVSARNPCGSQRHGSLYRKWCLLSSPCSGRTASKRLAFEGLAQPSVAVATASAPATGGTSCTRKTLAPRSSAITFVAIVPGRRSVAFGAGSFPAPGALPVRRLAGPRRGNRRGSSCARCRQDRRPSATIHRVGAVSCAQASCRSQCPGRAGCAPRQCPHRRRRQDAAPETPSRHPQHPRMKTHPPVLHRARLAEHVHQTAFGAAVGHNAAISRSPRSALTSLMSWLRRQARRVRRSPWWCRSRSGRGRAGLPTARRPERLSRGFLPASNNGYDPPQLLLRPDRLCARDAWIPRRCQVCARPARPAPAP